MQENDLFFKDGRVIEPNLELRLEFSTFRINSPKHFANKM